VRDTASTWRTTASGLTEVTARGYRVIGGFGNIGWSGPDVHRRTVRRPATEPRASGLGDQFKRCEAHTT
jgi:hypothetical protein